MQHFNILWYAGPLLGNDCEIKKNTTALTNGFANKHVCMAAVGNRNRGTVLCAVFAEIL
jgi:hypothetical protein